MLVAAFLEASVASIELERHDPTKLGTKLRSPPWIRYSIFCPEDQLSVSGVGETATGQGGVKKQ